MPPSTTWSPTSWQSRPALQQPAYADAAALERTLRELAAMPPLVTSWEIEALKQQLAEAAAGQRFLLQGGDCCETFDDCNPDAITSKLKILLQMSLVLVHGTHKPVIRVGRFAGQYAKPRSSDVEKSTGQQSEKSQGAGDQSLPVYRGDIVNRIDFTPEARRPDPVNLIRAHTRSALTLNFIRALIDGGFADLHHPEYWDLDFVQHSAPARAAEYRRIVEEIGRSLHFMESLAGMSIAEMSRVNFYSSHESLHLLYEQAQTRQVPRREGWYNLGTHFPWVGYRTSAIDGAHIEQLRGIRNPIAVKVGPDSGGTPAQSASSMREYIARLIDSLNPDDEPGRLTLIHRFGAKQIAQWLPPLIEAVRATGKRVLFVCDPMHGNTQTVSVAGREVKTRSFDHILVELEQAFEIHRAHGSHLGGVHFELTGDNVTECTGGARNVGEADLGRAYKSQVDPRLNYEQALEMAMRIAQRAK